MDGVRGVGAVSLPWVRLDSNIAGHDKILGLIAEPGGYRAAFAYVCSLGYAGGHGTDGLIAFNALTFVHATKATALLLVKHGLWKPDRLGWQIVNYGKRQQLDAARKALSNARRAAAEKGNCIRWHGPDCGCWEEAS